MKPHTPQPGLLPGLTRLLRPLTQLGAALAAFGSAGLLPLSAAIVPPTDNTAAPYLGLFTGVLGANPGFGGQHATGIDHHAETVSWLYRSGAFTHTGSGYAYNPNNTYNIWASIEGEAGMLNAAKKWLDQNPGGTIGYMQCMLPGIGNTPAPGHSLANGASSDPAVNYDAHFVTAAQRLVSFGIAGNVIIRIGHEFNGTWYPWRVYSVADAQNYAAYFRRIVTAMRSVPGMSDARFEWCGMTLANMQATLADAYPGDAYVDYIGVDIYDVCYVTNPPTYPYGPPLSNAERQWNAWGQLYYGNFGLQMWKNFAASRGKPFTLPEWGLSSRTNGGQDNPYFIQKMYDFIHETANNVYYHSYFDVNVSGENDTHLITSLPGEPATIFPNAAATFRRLFGIPPLRLNHDIGTVGLAGGGGVSSVAGAGAGYPAGGTSDSFHFTSNTVTGDRALQVKITSKSSATTAQSGLMLRAGTAANAAYVALYLANGDCVFQTRATAGGASVQHASVAASTLPVWLKLVRTGNTVAGYRSTDGLNWSFVAAQNAAIPASAHLGVAAASGNTTALNTTGIDQIDAVDLLVTDTAAIANAIILDNSAASGVTKTGVWPDTTAPADFYGANYSSDNNANKGSCTVRFSPTLPTTGKYEVYARWPACYDRAPAVPMSVTSTTGTAAYTANQVVGRNRWNHFGTFDFNAGTAGNVLIGNTGTVGHVGADAVMFVPVPSSALPTFTLFEDPWNNISYTASYGVIAGSVVGTDGAHAPYQGANQYKLAYTSGSVGWRLAFGAQNVTGATHLRIARKGPLTNSAHYLALRLVDSANAIGANYNLARTAAYGVVDIPLSSLSTGVNLNQVTGLMLYPTSPTAGQSDTIYLDNIAFIKKW